MHPHQKITLLKVKLSNLHTNKFYESNNSIVFVTTTDINVPDKWWGIAVIAVESVVKYSFKIIQENKAKGSIQRTIGPSTSFVCQITDNCTNSFPMDQQIHETALH